MVAGDMVIFPTLDRAFRNTRNALNVLHELKGRELLLMAHSSRLKIAICVSA